jgi:hypothetical protein
VSVEPERVEDGDLSHEQIAINQSRFREANEHIERAAGAIGIAGPIPFICECARTDCVEIVRLSSEAYEELREDPRLFVTALGHDSGTVEPGAGVVVGRGATYTLVQMLGVAGEIAEETYRGTNETS